MFKLVRKNIKDIEFNRMSAVLRGSGGMALFYVAIILGLITMPGGIILSLAAEEVFFVLLFGGLGLACILAALFSPIFEWFEVDQSEKTFKYFTATMLSRRDPDRAKVRSFSFDDLTIDWESVRQFGSVTIHIRAQDRSQFFLTLRSEKHAALIDWLSAKEEPVAEEGAAVGQQEAEFQTDAELSLPSGNLYEQKDAMGHAAMLKEISSWGTWSLVLGAIHLVASGTLNPGWGITLLAVGGLSFLVKESAMFVMYAVTLLWVGISNILSLNFGSWTFLGVFQIYLGIMLFQKFRRYRNYERDHLGSAEEPPTGVKVGRAAKLFPWLGTVLAGVGLLVYVGVWVAIFVAIFMAYDSVQGTNEVSESVWSIFDLISGVALGFGIVGFGLSLSSVISKFTPKWLSWIGLVFGCLLILLDVLVRFWVILGG